MLFFCPHETFSSKNLKAILLTCMFALYCFCCRAFIETMPNICWLQLLNSEDLLLFPVFILQCTETNIGCVGLTKQEFGEFNKHFCPNLLFFSYTLFPLISLPHILLLILISSFLHLSLLSLIRGLVPTKWVF